MTSASSVTPRAARLRVLVPVRIDLPTAAIDCVARDLSTTGALLVLPRSVALPTTFEIALDFATETMRVPVRLRWRKGTRVGVQFFARRGDLEALAGGELADQTPRPAD